MENVTVFVIYAIISGHKNYVGIIQSGNRLIPSYSVSKDLAHHFDSQILAESWLPSIVNHHDRDFLIEPINVDRPVVDV